MAKSEIVTLEHLDSSMRIESYVGFNNRFNLLTPATCKWLKHNFNGVIAQVKRGDVKLKLPIDEVQAGDMLVELQSFPERLKKLTVVNKLLIDELKKRGFRKFRVRRIQKKLTRQQSLRQAAVAKTKALIQKAKKGVAVSRKATLEIEHLMQQTQGRKMDVAGVSSFVDDIINSQLTEAIGVVTSLKKSDQTYTHCIEVGAIFQNVYIQILKGQGVELSDKQQSEMLLGAFLHDIGKSRIPKEILESTIRFDRESPEMQLMQTHPAYGAEILADFGSSDTIINMAHYHHVKLVTDMRSSYPPVDSYDLVMMETRLIAIVDVYQALVGRRSYKKLMGTPAAMNFIDQLAGIEFDTDIWESFYRIMGKYPVGSLVKLSEGSTAFVVQAAEVDFDKPQVAVIKNAKGEDLKHNTLINLADEPDIKIVSDLDNYEVLGDNSLEIFTSLKIM